MKKILFILLLGLTLPLSAKDVITVFRVSGDVSRCAVRGDKWNALNKRDTVMITDRIRVPEGGMVKLLSSESGVIHTCSKIGVFTVKQIIKEAQSQNRSLLGAVTGEVVDEMKSKASSNKKSLSRVHGATHRGRDGVVDNKVEKALAKQINRNKSRMEVLFRETGDACQLGINNKGKERRVSAVCLSPDGAAFCLPPEGVIVPKGETFFEALEIIPSPGVRYVAFEVKSEYDAEELLSLLSSRSPLDAF